MPDIFTIDGYYQGSSQACIIDITPPTFAGLASAVVASRGQIRTTWAAATDASPPVHYEIYIQASTATGLFNVANIVGMTDKLLFDTWTTPDGVFLVNGTTYYVGVRAVDAVGNRDSNIVSVGLISTGIFVSADVYLAEGAFTVGANNMFQGTMWILKNSVLGTGATLGTASYQVYDKAGVAVPGMGQTGISADSNGQFKITPVVSARSESLEHYLVKVDITMDSAVRTGYVPLIEPPPEYQVEGVFGLDTSNNFVASFWCTANEQVVSNPARLGTASYQVYDRLGNAVSGMTQTGITPDSLGLFKITPVASSLETDLAFYSVKVSITVDGVTRSEFLPITGKVPEYETKATFSINASNQFQATLWATVDGKVKKGTGLGTASYTVYDNSGTPVSGLTQSGIAADGNGRFQITPVSASLLVDLTHYSVRIAIFVDGVERESYRGFTLLGS